MKIQEQIKTQGLSNAHQRATVNILFTAGWLERCIDASFKPHGISQQQFNVLRILRGQHPKCVNLNQISERMIDQMSNVTRLVEKLRTKELVRREVCATNRRKVEISLTNKGLDLLRTLSAIHSRDVKKMFSKLSKKEAEQINVLLDKLRESHSETSIKKANR